MSKHRFDHRNKEIFKKDIYFATQIEKYLFNRWVEICGKLDYINVINYMDNGICNDGSYIEDKPTSGADYMADISYNDSLFTNLPIEVKFVPTPGKMTLKEGDLKAYKREGAAILFIYNINKRINLKKRKDYDHYKQIENLKANEKSLRWGIMLPHNVAKLTDFYDVKPIFYMGGKPGIIIKSKDYDKWFTEEPWYAY